MRLESAYAPEQCRMILRAALSENKKSGQVQGRIRGGFFRLTMEERFSFWHRNMAGYTMCGYIGRGPDGCAGIRFRRFLGIADPFRFIMLFAVLLLTAWLPVRVHLHPLAVLAIVLSCCLFAICGVWGNLRWRADSCEALRGELDAFLCETLAIRQTWEEEHDVS